MAVIAVVIYISLFVTMFVLIKEEKRRRGMASKEVELEEEGCLTRIKCNTCTHVHYVKKPAYLIDDTVYRICPWCENESTFEIINKGDIYGEL